MNDLFTINTNISWKLLNDAIVAVNLDSGDYYTFNFTASLIWQYVDEKKPTEEIIALFKEQFPETDDQQIDADLKEIFDFWIAEKLISKTK